MKIIRYILTSITVILCAVVFVTIFCSINSYRNIIKYSSVNVICSNDGTKLSLRDHYCTECGNEVYEIGKVHLFSCENCGEIMSEKKAYCPNCGSAVKEEDVPLNQYMNNSEYAELQNDFEINMFGRCEFSALCILVIICLWYIILNIMIKE